MAIEIDWNFVDKMLEAGNPGTRIAEALGCHEDTLYLRCKEVKNMTFSAYAAQKRAKGDNLLLSKQYEVAMKGNVSMLIWLGKNRLSQKDKQDIEVLTELASGLNDLLSAAARNNSKISSTSQPALAAGEPLLDKELPGAESQVLS